MGAHEFVTDIWAAWGQGSNIKRESPVCVHEHFGNKIVRIVSMPTQKSYLEILSQEKSIFKLYISFSLEPDHEFTRRRPLVLFQWVYKPFVTG